MTFADEGEPCGFDLDTLSVTACNAGLSCVEQADGTSMCVAQIADGEPCSEDEGPTCQIFAFCVDGVCTLSEDSGTTCEMTEP